MFTKIHKNISSFFKKNNKVVLITIFTLLILLSLFPRSIDVLNQNPIFGFDQGREMLAARDIALNHNLILIGTELGAGSSGISGIFHGPVYYYLLSIAFVLFNGNPVGGVFMIFLFSLLAVFLGFYFGKKTLGLYIGLFIAILMSISPILIAQARFLWSPNPTTFFILLSFIYTYNLFLKKKYIIFLASFFAGFIYNFELAIAVPMSIALVIYSTFIFKKEIKYYFYLFLGFLVAFSPMILFEIRHGFMGVKGLIFYLTQQDRNSDFSTYSILIDHAKTFIYNFKDTFPIDNFYFAALFFTLLIFFSFLTLINEKDKKLKYFFSFLLLLLPVNFLVFSFLKNTVWNFYLTDLSVSYILLLCYLIYTIFRNKSYIYKILSMSLICVFLILGINNAIKVSVYDYSDYGGTAKLKGKLDAIDYIYKDAKKTKFGVLIFSPPVYTYPYEYIFEWYGKEKYNYTPYYEKKGTYYLLIEPDSAKPWSYKGWIETVIKSSDKIEKTTQLSNGYIIQKRIAND